MLAKRIIPCLDVANGNVVKGVQFRNLTPVGDPVEYAQRYNDEGADELVFLDISASAEERPTRYDWVRKVAQRVFIPFTVGGGIRSLQDMERLLESGADKVALNTAAVDDAELIRKAARAFGSQFVVLSIDALFEEKRWKVTTQGARTVHTLEPLEWGQRCQELGAGEVLLSVINADGTQQGYNVELTRKFSETLGIPVIASGGAGTLEDFLRVLTDGKADAALAASVFHYGTFTLRQVKEFLRAKGVPIRTEQGALQ